MGWFSDDSPQSGSYDQWQNSNPREHEASFAHELIAGAASYEAAKAYEDHVARNGQPPSHEKAKEILAGFAGAFIDREVETKGLDFIDREKAKRQAREHFDSVPGNQVGY
ncbi:CipC1 protein [Talaromyces proteolyticus]|uniref:CipC1 protein n=1 Tax=Talaromyces proteolyticus TaxID=1131652 RepID=A0AAD4L278_9EURO|nr:CipC1 protein [Talaromyces proteolyticus]KAH8705824.1 CipC1 protein [Talaromyces proteolyticus]